MFTETLSHHIGIPLAEVEQLLSLSMDDLYQDSAYRYLIRQLDVDQLYETLPEARALLDANLPALVAQVKAKYRLDYFPLTSYMLCNWVVGFLRYPDEVWRMIEKHTDVPPHLVREVVPEVLSILAGMQSGAALWQHTLATIVLPLGSDARVA